MPTIDLTDIQKTVPERAAVLRERAAFERGAIAEYDHYFPQLGGPQFDVLGSTQGGRDTRRAKMAAVRFPLPRVTRPRVLKDEYGYEWRLHAGYIAWRMNENQEWSDKLCSSGGLSLTITKGRACVIAALLDDPTEEVDA